MKATFTTPRKPFNPNFRKENHFRQSFIGLAVTEKGVQEAVDLRIYATDTTAYCAVWVYDEKHVISGTGSARGYGYHKASAAASEALYNAGIELSESIDARGDDAIRAAVEAIMQARYPDAKFYHIVNAFG